jgi:hypothetical protein
MRYKVCFSLIEAILWEFDLMGFKFKDQYYFDKCLPMGAAVSCALFESFSTALHWFVQNQSGCDDILHYLDDFLFRESAGSTQCKDILKLFQNSCKLWGVPLADNKTVEPTEVLIFLGIEFDTINMVMRLPDEKLIELRNKIESCLACTKISLRDLQSLIGSLTLRAKVIVPG